MEGLGFTARCQATVGWLDYFETHRNSKETAAARANPEFVSSYFRVSTALPSFAQNSFASVYASPLIPIGGPKPTCALFFAMRYVPLSIGTMPVLAQPTRKSIAMLEGSLGIG